MAENRIVDVTDRVLVRQLLEQNSARISYSEMKNATSEAWKTFVLVNVDNRFATFVKCVDCCNILNWKHRDGTSTLLTHRKKCSKRKCDTKITTMPLMKAANNNRHLWFTTILM